MDLFPTLVQLVTGRVIERNSIVDESGMTLDGTSVLSPASLPLYTYSQYPRCRMISNADGSSKCVNSDYSCDRLPNIFMGYMVRTATEKYVEWRPFVDSQTDCTQPNWPGLNPKLRIRMEKWIGIDANKTGTDWKIVPPQRELYNDYQSTASWGSWENSNVLVRSSLTTIARSLELSVAIRWMFDQDFAGGNFGQPCSGNGAVKLKIPLAWTSLRVQPSMANVTCSCNQGWIGPVCATQRSERM